MTPLKISEFLSGRINSNVVGWKALTDSYILVLNIKLGNFVVETNKRVRVFGM